MCRAMVPQVVADPKNLLGDRNDVEEGKLRKVISHPNVRFLLVINVVSFLREWLSVASVSHSRDSLRLKVF